MDARTLDDAVISERTVGLRVDINSPIEDGRPADDARFQAHLGTIEELLERNGAVVVMAHQGRPGGDDFTSLAGHAEHLGELLGREVAYVDAVCSTDARRAIDELAAGELLCIENLRFASEELLTLDPVAPAETHLVTRLSSVLDVYVNDAFAVSHRSQPSVVGFPAVLPSFAGRLMTREVSMLGDLEASPAPRIALLAGAKVDDSLTVLERLLTEELVDRVLVGGVVANAFFLGAGYDPGPATEQDVAERGYAGTVDWTATLVDRFGDRIVLPNDVAVPVNDGRDIIEVDAFPLAGDAVPRDIGPATIDAWRSLLSSASTVICNGPLGQFEDERFADGTAGLFEAAAGVEQAIAGGGDTSAALGRFGIDGFTHVSTGGGASLALLSGSTLPGVEALSACTIEQPD